MLLKEILLSFSINLLMTNRVIGLHWITCPYYADHGFFSEFFEEYEV